MRLIPVLIGLWGLTAGVAISTAAEVRTDVREGAPLTLGQGEQRLIQLPGLKRYSIGSPILRSIPSPFAKGDSLMLKAIEPGRTDLWVWKQDGSAERRSVRVMEWRKESGSKSLGLDRAISQLEEVEVLLAGGSDESQTGYLLRGEFHSLREATRIRVLRKAHPDSVHDESVPSNELLSLAEKTLEHWLASSRFKEALTLERYEENRSLWLRGSIENPREREEAETRAQALCPFVKLEISSLPDASPTIHFKVFLLEMKKNKMRSLGLDWNGTSPGAVKVSRWGISESIQLEATLNALEGEGSAKILSRPELVVRAPGEAELFAGGELPIETHTPYNSQVSWRQFGLLLRLKVLHVTRRKVRVDVTTEVSHLDPKIAVRNIPGMQANRMKTQVDAAFGAPLLLSGLLQESLHETARGIPGLSRLPVLGTLFGSRDYQNDRSELVAILLPASEPPRAPMEVIERASAMAKRPLRYPYPDEERKLRASPDFPWNAFPEEKKKSTKAKRS